MSTLSWVTPEGTLANFLIGAPTNVAVLATDPTHSGLPITYTLIGGELPPGMTLSSAGILSGTPIYSSPTNTYFTTVNYSFIIRARSNDITIAPVDGKFTAILSNIVNGDFRWITPAGNLGTVPSGEFYKLPIQAESVSNSTITFSVVSGELPPGMQLVSSGFLQGVPEFLNPLVVNESLTYRFTIRATNGAGRVNDQSFSLTVTNVYGPIIRPNTEFLGSNFDGTYYSQQLRVQELNPAVQIQWAVVAGSLPPGLTLDSNGLISGWVKPIELIGQFGPSGYDGNNTQNVGLTGVMLNANITETTMYVGTLSSGSITTGMLLSGTGVASGTYIVNNLSGTDNGSMWTVSQRQLVSATTITGVVTDTMLQQEYDGYTTVGNQLSSIPYDFNQVNQHLSYSFSIQAFDGANYDTQHYILDVISRSGFTADSTIPVNDTYLSVDSSNVYTPVLLNANTILPTGRQGSWYAFKLDGYDFQGDTITYNAANEAGTFDCYLPGVDAGFDWDANPFDGSYYDGPGFDNFSAVGVSVFPGLSLDDQNGWLYGNIATQTEALKEYRFGFYVSKTHGNTTSNSSPTYFTLQVTGDINNVINWVSPINLGSINNGSVSELSIKATSASAPNIVYSLYGNPGTSIRLPQGLTLLPSGDISGRTSFEAFMLDKNTTTFDKKTLTLDRTFNFTVQASATGNFGTITSLREFTLTLNVINETPYENLYLRAMNSRSQRDMYQSITNDNTIFNDDTVYRPTDPWFGVQQNLDMLFLSGLSPESIAKYQEDIAKNHWTKTYTFGDIKTAVVLDDAYNVVYEVIYVDLLDPTENAQGQGPGLELNLTGIIAHPYVDINGNSHEVLYPNTSTNMELRLDPSVIDRSSLPSWMTSNQVNPADPTKFLAPLGYTKAVILAYANPGQGNKLAYRLKKSNIDFNNIEFTVNRYEVDDYYTNNFDITTNSYTRTPETTFDTTQRSVGIIAASVSYAVDIPFSEINGRPVSYINANGGIDGRTDYLTGQKILFAKQEYYVSNNPYYGWTDYTSGYIGDDITTSAIEGYPIAGYPGGTGSYDTYSIIPGYFEKLSGLSTVNQRGGIWQINIINNLVYLEFVQEIQPNQRVQVFHGKSYSGATLFYSPILTGSQTVPYYKIFDVNPNMLNKPTTFNNNTTRFFSGRDQYYKPTSQDKYLNFPQTGVF